MDAIDQVMSDITVNPARFGFAKANVREGAIQRFSYVMDHRPTRSLSAKPVWQDYAAKNENCAKLLAAAQKLL